MIAQAIRIKNPSDFEKVVALFFQRQGYEITLPPANTKGYDIELRKNGECIAVQVKNYSAKVRTAQVIRFQHFLELPMADRFTQGWFISATGFFKPALAHIGAEQPENFRLGTFTAAKDQVSWDYGSEEPSPPPPAPSTEKTKYIGVFTCKGGVGKTTVAAHLAGAFALMGHDVILLDLDPDRNLRKLFANDINDEDASIFVPPINKHEIGTSQRSSKKKPLEIHLERL